MTLTIDNLPSELDAAIRQRAEEEHRPVDEVVVDAIKAGLSVINGAKVRDSSDLAGSWVDGPEFDAAIRDQDQIDPDLWR